MHEDRDFGTGGRYAKPEHAKPESVGRRGLLKAGLVARADASIAIHADGGPASGYGFAALVPELIDNSDADNRAIIKPSAEFAQALLRHFRQATGQPLSNYLGSGGIQPRSDLAGLNLSTVPKIFIECANMRNARDAGKVTDPHWRDAAEGIAASIKAFVLG
jgi:N-acetylmuramoyl-L-alanine amidase